jgi:DNA modification methylase
MREVARKAPELNGTSSVDAFEFWTGKQSPTGPDWHLYGGDAREVLKALAPAQVSCVVTSPPYFWQRDYEVPGQIGLEPSIEVYVRSVCNAMQEVKRVLHPKGVLFLNLGDTYYSAKGRPQGHDPKHNGRRLKVLRAVDTSGLGKPQKTLLGMPWRVALRMIDRDWVLRAPIIWRRESPIPEPNVKDRPWRTYEFVFLFSKSRHYRFRRGPLKAAGVEDVWTVESRPRAGNGHPAVFPPELVRRCLKLGNPTKGLVLDPFVGSGTVLRVALELGMPAIGIDLNLRFCRRIAADLNRGNHHAGGSGRPSGSLRLRR